MSYWRLYFHVVWATKRRDPVIDARRADVIERSLRDTGHELSAVVHAIGIMPDHVHIALSSPPRFSVSDVAQRLKGNSSHLLNHGARLDDEAWFAWQPEFGVVSFGERALPDVIDYVANQRRRHADRDLWPMFETVDNPVDRRPHGDPS